MFICGPNPLPYTLIYHHILPGCGGHGHPVWPLWPPAASPDCCLMIIRIICCNLKSSDTEMKLVLLWADEWMNVWRDACRTRAELRASPPSADLITSHLVVPQTHSFSYGRLQTGRAVQPGAFNEASTNWAAPQLFTPAVFSHHESIFTTTAY